MYENWLEYNALISRCIISRSVISLESRRLFCCSLVFYKDKLVRMEGATFENCKQSWDTVSLRYSDENLCKDCDRQRLGKQQDENKIADEVEAEEVGRHLENYATASAPSMGLVTTDADVKIP